VGGTERVTHMSLTLDTHVYRTYDFTRVLTDVPGTHSSLRRRKRV